MHDKISIIIPVYNVANYLREALDSVLKQTYINWEAICVNDGSKDNSLEILKEYAQKDSRFIIIDQENAGVSKARNVALDKATGEYIMFLDSDDYFKRNALEDALKAIKKDNSDICIFCHEHLKNGEIVKPYRTKIIEEAIDNNSNVDLTIHLFLWSKIYKRSFLNANNIRFEENQHTAEDIIFSYETLFYNAKYSITKDILYVYRFNRENSLTTANINGIKSDIKAAKRICAKKMYEKQTLEMKKNIADRWFSGCFYYYNKFNTLQEHLYLYIDILKMLSFWEKMLGKKNLEDIDNYRQLKCFHKKLLKEIFPQKTYSDDFEEYLKEINFEKSFKKLKKKLKNKKIIIYGSGSFYQYIANKYDFSDINVIGISDMKFSEEQEGQKLNAYNIIPKEKMKNYNPDCIIIATKNYENILNDFKLNIFKSTNTKVLPLAKVPLF